MTNVTQDLAAQIAQHDRKPAEAPTPQLVEQHLALFHRGPHRFLTALRGALPDLWASPQRARLRIVELGCGSGVATILPLRLDGFDGATGLDLSTHRIAVGHAVARRLGVPTSCLRRLTIQDWLEEREPVDLVLGQGILAYFPDYGPLLRALRQRLAPGGCFFFREPSLFPFAILREARYDRHAGEWFTRASFPAIVLNPFTIRRNLEAAGFTSIRVYGDLYRPWLTRMVGSSVGLLLARTLCLQARA